MKALDITARDGMTISGNLYGDFDKLIILLHGLTDFTDTSYLNRQSVNLFLEKGYSVYAPDLYSDEELNGEKPRALYGSVTIKRHAEDAQDIYDYFKEKYNKIFIAGHSFGGLATNIANIDCAAQALWDPTFHAEGWSNEDDLTYVGDIPVMNWLGQKIIINQTMIRHAETISKKVAGKYTSELLAPTYVAVTEQCLDWNKFYQIYLKDHSKYEVLEATHIFNEPGKLEELINKTHEFFERF